VSATPPREGRLQIALAGNPNAGKTTLFNSLTGASARTGNYPGITVERRTGRWRLSDTLEAELLDVPGTYSLSARSPEEQVAVDAVLPTEGSAPDVVVVVADAGALERHLYLACQIIDIGLPTVLALNLMDEATKAGVQIDLEGLRGALGVPIVPLVATRAEGVEELAAAVAELIESEPVAIEPEELSSSLGALVEPVERLLEELRPEDTTPGRRARALWALLSLGDDELQGIDEGLREVVAHAHQSAATAERDLDREIIEARYARIDDRMRYVVTVPAEARGGGWTPRIDAVLTHPLLGALVFAAAMLALFEALFRGSEPLIGGVEAGVGFVQTVATDLLPEGAFRDLLIDGVIAGVGNVVVFVPQIAMLFAFVAVLEDSGYLARVAFMIDRLMRGVGLHGKAFVPLLSGFACAVPAVMATRTIESRKDRLVTMLALPLMSCSARLPVYALVIAIVFPSDETVGFVSVGALVLFSMYALSVASTLGAAAVLRRTVLRGPRPALVLELPPYRWPAPRNILSSVWRRVKSFLVDAGTIILAITILLWALLTYPKDESVPVRFADLRATAEQTLEGDALADRLSELDVEEAQEQLRSSAAGSIGRAIEPVIEPLGFDWRIGIGLIGSFAAREVLVSTLGIVWGIGDDSDESEPLREALRDATWPDGRPLFTTLTGLALMVFFVLAAQCMSTVAVVYRESGSWKWPALMVLYMTVLAYVGALVVQQGGQLLGYV